MTLTYSDYLKLDQLLTLQRARSEPPEHDETLFIVIHQVYELWFVLLLHELEKIKRDFSRDDLFGAIATFPRGRWLTTSVIGQGVMLEEMATWSCGRFRDRL